MLAADKLQLQSAVKQQATALKEKEFNLHHSNMMTVGTQAAVLAGLNTTMFIEFQPSPNNEWGNDLVSLPRVLKFFYYITIVSAFCANILVVAQTSLLSITATSLALRGPDGSMMTATDGLYEERNSVFKTFGFGLGATVASVVICVWLYLHPESAAVCMGITVFTAFRMYKNFIRVSRKFGYNEADTVDFNDIFEGPAAITAVWKKKSEKNKYPTSDNLSQARNCSAETDSLVEKGQYPWNSFLQSKHKTDPSHCCHSKMTNAFSTTEKRRIDSRINRRRRREKPKSKWGNSDYEYDSDTSPRYSSSSSLMKRNSVNIITV